MRGSVLLTGGLGQIGPYLCEGLLSRGYGVTILDDPPSGIDPRPPGVNFVNGDVRDARLIKSLVSGSDVVIHCTAPAPTPGSLEGMVYDAGANVIGTLNLLDAARNGSLDRFVYFSSAAVYGNPLKLPVNELHPQNPISAYGASKLAGEKYTLMFNKAYGLPTTAIRPFNIYGPWQGPSCDVIAKFIDSAGSDKPPAVYGDGSATRDFVSVHDVVGLVLLMVENDLAIGKVFNCGTGNKTRIDELAAAVIRSYRKGKLKPEFLPERPGDIKYSCADISLAKRVLGYNPGVHLEEGLREIIESKKKSAAPKPRYSQHMLKLISVDMQ